MEALLKPPFNCPNTGCSYPNCICGQNLSNNILTTNPIPVSEAKKTAEEILAETIKKYNSEHSQVNWFQFNKFETKLFTDMMEYFANHLIKTPLTYVGTVETHIKWVGFLRSKSIALPWMDLTIEDLQNYGWVKLR